MSTALAERIEQAKNDGLVRAIRQSLINTADICLVRAGYDLKPPGPKTTSQSAAIGTAYHAGLETYYRWRQQVEQLGPQLPGLEPDVLERALTAAREALAHEAKYVGEWDTSESAAWSTVERMLTAYLEQHTWPEGWTVLGVEHPFWLPSSWPGWVWHGTIDLIMQWADNPLAVLVDHKTSSRKWAKDKGSSRKTSQPAIYTFAWQQLSGEPAGGFYFDIMKHDGTFERRPSTPHQTEVDAVLSKVGLYIQLLESHSPEELPPNTASNLCSERYCSWWNYCPFGAAMAGLPEPPPS